MGRFANSKITMYLLIFFSLILFGINFSGMIPVGSKTSFLNYALAEDWWKWLAFALFNCFYVGMMIIVIMAPVTKLKDLSVEEVAELEEEMHRIVIF